MAGVSPKIQAIQEKCNELAERESRVVIQFPSPLIQLSESRRGVPNSFIRSALFAAIQSKDRVFMKEKTLFSQKEITVKFTGEQLNQEDLTVWMTLVDLAKEHPLGNLCTFTAYQILKALSFPKGGEQNRLLHSSIIRLTACAVEIRHEGRRYFGSLIEGGLKDEATSHYTLRLNRDLLWLFDDDKWTAINWEQRKQLRRKPLAQFLHEYYGSHKLPHPVTLSFLQNLTGSRNGQAADFKRKVKAAFEGLVKIGFLESYSIKNDMVSVRKRAVAGMTLENE